MDAESYTNLRMDITRAYDLGHFTTIQKELLLQAIYRMYLEEQVSKLLKEEYVGH